MSACRPRAPAPVPERPRRRARPADVVGGALLGVVAGALGTAVHLNLASLPGAAAGTLRHGRGRALPAGAAVVAGAFTAVLALQRLPVDDALGLSWTAGLWAAAPGAVVASVAWNVGHPALGMVLLAAGRRLDRRPAEAAEAATRPRRATVTARETRPGERVPWTAAPQPRAQREVDGQS